MTFKITVDMGNDAFAEDAGRLELARILRDIVDRLENGSQTQDGIYDVNGNRVGAWSIK